MRLTSDTIGRLGAVAILAVVVGLTASALAAPASVSVDGPATAAPGDAVTISFSLENTGMQASAYILDVAVPSGWSIESHADAGATWKQSDVSWLWQTVEPGEAVAPSLVLRIPSDAGGEYTVSATGKDSGGIVDTGSTTVTVDGPEPPGASFTYAPSEPTVGETVSFDASGSSDPDGAIQAYQWDFGDGATGTGQTVDHAFGASGTYAVTLAVTDDDGQTNETTRTVVVEPAGDSFTLTADDVSARPGETVTVGFALANGGQDSSAILNVSAPSSFAIVDQEPDGATWKSASSSWLWQTVGAGETVRPNLTLAVPADAAGDYAVTARVLTAAGVAANLTVNVSVEPQFPRVGDFEEPATDPDGDGLAEDVNGDGAFTIVDLQALFVNRNDDSVLDNPDVFDFNGDGSFTIIDLQALFIEFK